MNFGSPTHRPRHSLPNALPFSGGNEEAASFFNKCRARGIQGSNTDYLICAAAARRGFGILTTDTDFAHFARVLPIELHFPRASVTG